MKFPIWFKKSNGGFFYIPTHPAGWVCYLISFLDMVAAFYKLSQPGMNSTEQIKAVFPILVLNFAVLAVVIFFTTEKPKEEN